MKTHIVGSSGYIASEILSRIHPGDVMRYSPDGLPGELFLDLTDLSDFDFSAFSKGDYAIFLAAISSPDACENQYALAHSINVTGTIQFIERLVAKAVNVLFFSSDVVNGATEFAHDETSPAKPFGKYGEMKYEVEKYFRGCPQLKVFRLSYVFSETDKFMKYIRSCDTQKTVADVYDALYRNVIYVEDIIDAVFALGRSFSEWKNAVFNLSGKDLLSRKDLAEIYKIEISKSFVYNTSVPDAQFFAARPNVIETKSLYLRDLLNRETTSIGSAMRKEFGEENANG